MGKQFGASLANYLPSYYLGASIVVQSHYISGSDGNINAAR